MIAGMPEYVTNVSVRASRSDVFRAIADPQQSAKYLSRVVRVEPLDDPPFGLHASYREWRLLENGREVVQDFKVIELVAEQLCTVQSTSAGVCLTFTASFKEGSGETLVAIRCRAHGVTLAGKLLLPLVWLFAGPSARKALRDDLEEIKAGVELSVRR